MTIKEYITAIQKIYETGSATEHTYRHALLDVLSTLLPNLLILNETKRINCGAPDYILMRRQDKIPVAFVETKDIDDKDLQGRKGNKEQFDRYRSSLDNICFTDYLDFHFYEKGGFVESIRIADLHDNKIVAIEDNFDKFKYLIERFGNAAPHKITSSVRLAKIMAAKARLLANVIEKVVEQDQKNNAESELKNQLNAFKEALIHDITPKEFADVYAQTITYGMFAARLYDPTPEDFSRQEAAELIPKTNPFLRKLFQHVAGYDLDERISWIVDDLAETFHATDMAKVMSGYDSLAKSDPLIHFYENFLTAYDPKQRKSRGVWYTPKAVVTFIVKAVDDILKTEFGLPMGLADTSKIKGVEQSHDNRYTDGKKKRNVEYHRVQILDPATGTGTFLAEIVKQIHDKFKGQEGLWQSYVKEHLLPRLNGFELLMAPYAMAHLKISWLLDKTGYKPVNDKRLRIYLTNSLEEYHKEVGALFSFLATEANEASRIKRDTPMMIILGNPPYSGISKNDKTWISKLIDNYKYIDGVHFNERKHWLNDDYVKFIRLGQYYVDKNDNGILAYINNHSFLDNPTFRGMRWNLLKSFDKIYILDLHGNSKKKEKCPDGTKDENVFNIQQGVSINIFVKTGKKGENELAKVFHSDIWGKRQFKYDFLQENNLKSVVFKELTPTEPFYFFIPQNESGRNEYESGFCLNELMPINTTGIVTARDFLVIDQNKEKLLNRIKEFADSTKTDDEIRQKFFPNKKSDKYLPGDTRGWKLSNARHIIKGFDHENIIQKISYRPFDENFIYYSSTMVDWGRENLFRNFLIDDRNIGIVVSRQCVSDWRYVFCTKHICTFNLTGTAGRFGAGYVFPLYLYDTLNNKRHPNLKQEIVDEIANIVGLEFEAEKSGKIGKFAPIDLLDYIYAVLHSPTYRKKYIEFLKSDFPRIPYPTSADEFLRLAELGRELRLLHLLEHSELNTPITQYPIDGSNIVEKVRFETLSDENGRVWINDNQYFDNVPTKVWDFYIGGYQPAQKWLKDRMGRLLSYSDLSKYQCIVKALVMTDVIMGKIDA